jgi:hypothetical protein
MSPPLVNGTAVVDDVQARLIRGEKGAIKPCEHNAFELLAAAEQYAGLHFDQFYWRPRLDDGVGPTGSRDWTDADDREAQRWLQRAYQTPGFTFGITQRAALSLAHARPCDSLQSFVLAPPDWDQRERIDAAFTDAWGAPDDAVTRAASRNFFVALIARALKPGAQVDTVWCFEGPQGIGKSRALRALGREFHAEITAPIGTADFMRELRGVWIAEMSELDSLRGREASTVKRLLSAPVDRFVQKYALHAESYPRRAVAVATTNEVDYWLDPTGARRLVPIRCGTIRVDLVAANRLQWLAEAKHSYLNGATWWEFPAGMAEAQDERQAVDPWEDTLRDLIAHGRPSGDIGLGFVPWPDGPITSAEVMGTWLGLTAHQQGRASGVRLGHVMRRLGFEPTRIGHDRDRGWKRRVADTEHEPQ